MQIDTWQQLCAAVDAGVLGENQWVEHKKDIPAGKNSSGELAKDLASLSVEGGLLVVGAVDKISDSTGLVGVEDPEGLRDRIGQVAENRVKPLLNVVVDVVRDEQEQRPCLLVTVHSSASAPHMVEDRYWGRGATGKRPLADSEVRRLLAERTARADDFTHQLVAMSDEFDPVPPDARRFGHIYLYAKPVMPPTTCVTDVLAPKQPVEWVRGFLPGRANYSRVFQEVLEHRTPHADGLMVSSDWRNERTVSSEEYAVQLLLEDDGGLRVSSCEGTREWRGAEAKVISPNYHLELAHQVVTTAAGILDTYAGYRGAWTIGVHATGLRGCLSTLAMTNTFRSSDSPFQTSAYTSVTESSTEEMLVKAPAVVERLYSRFTRGLGLDTVFFPYDTFADISAKTDSR
ncbi:helix-turn-helix domain-containing protein [Amycolatopsis sp. cmx-4-54]|uniref:AlbA family DNA-binding domain-containing protein n=1 Tax=Amycolatopsis sp. cmx-4-54 TaxID=2790936 RepID=UPI0039789D4D